MTAEDIKDEFIAYCEASDYGQGSPHIPWDFWVANVLLPRETKKAYYADRDCGCVQQ
jgi:hypothetical protein